MTRSLSLVLALALAATLPAAAAPHKPTAAHPKTVTLPDGLQYTDLKVGKGALPKAGQIAVVHYTGTFPDGKKFDSSRGGKPLEFPLGERKVIACWDEGVATMRVGGRRKLVCPPDLAYGAKGYPGAIPPNATLLFDVELLGVK
jgi:peptidylprolyl isomerase